MIVLVLSIVFIGLSSAQLVQNLKCDPDINLEPNFDVSKFLGKWHVVRRTERPGHPIHCSHLELVNVNDEISLHDRVVNQNFLEEVKSPAAHHEGTAKLTIDRSDPTKPKDFWILRTDYTSFAIAFACEDNGSTRNVTIWQLGRETYFPTGMIEALMNQSLFNSFGITRDHLTPVDHSETACKTLPEIPPGQNVILPGQCDENIAVVQNFNVSGFMGEWFGISSYFSANQLGECGRAKYTLTDSGVVVENSQVANQMLEVIKGRAVVSSTDNSAKLLVTLEIRPGSEPKKYNNNYAISYNCNNLPNNQKQVNAWILSRTRQLTNEAQIAVDEVINREPDLNKRFFIVDNQTDESCFYYPEPAPKTPVIFRGQCDVNIPVMKNFNATAYMGLWHNIQSYPSISQAGSCNNARYTLKDGFVDVFNTQVVGEQLLSINGVARVASADGSAKLTVNFPIAGTDSVSTANYWVLDTDYESYALVYSCVNIDDEIQQVTSWKLSRTKELSAEGSTAINAIIQSIRVLDQRYFEDNDQSPEGCFYFPDPQPGVPVVFPGQCDVNIQAVSSFNMTEFQGIWHEIEAYPKEQQTGHCVNHEYTLGTGNALNLISASVLDQIRDTTNSQVTFTSAQDTSGRLTITLTSGGSVINIPFWIIETDYTSYALAYSCLNIDNDYRKVFSWKLSRTQQLTSGALLAIDEAMQNIDVLQHKYFETIKQTDDACFYLPDPVPGLPVTFSGKCDESLPVVQNFDAPRYLGRWRRISSYPEPFQIGKCNEATYSLNADGSTVDVYNTQVINGELDTINGTAIIASNDGSAKLWVNFPSTPEPAPYWVLDTDYDSYALVYSCRDLPNNRRRVTSWKLSRTAQLTAAAAEKINQVVNSINVLNDRYFEIDDQSDQACFYLPPPGPSTPIFRGQCDLNIPALSNFNAAAYLGQWYDIASYNTAFQQGTCNSAYYSLGDGVVDVFNTQVVNQRLDTMTGVARVVSDDGSAKLSVTFPVAGTNENITTPYWVLATDYTSYSLVYTCVNIDAERQQVWSWKLGREKQLTNVAETAINRVISNVPVLDDRYYVKRDHSNQGCFYYPEPEAGIPVEFPGQCDPGIQAATNFNMTAFQGIWHEIEAYPKEQQTGHCVNHEYTLGTGNALNLISTSVLDQIRGITNSQVTFTSAQDTSGRLTITLTSGGSVITIPFWVIKTDYTSFALAYSCVNINNNYRRVFSWKLSRTQQLTSGALLAIDEAMQNIDVLQHKYFETIKQTDDACFYLPDPVPGLPVTFPGKCDESISVVQNFDAPRYLGRWRRISSYPEPFQIGKCNEATYSLNADGSTVDVYNTQVINGELDTINGTAIIASNDGSAKLWVNFPNTPEPAPYWVLDTDYDSYALVYSCRDLPNSRRRGAWKLSRTAQLTAAAAEKINQVVNSINVLNDRYFEIDDQSDQACFYLPPPGPSTPIFRGQCDLNIPALSNFNAAAYLGQWYDIASYNTAFQQGTCNSAYYSLGDGVVDVFNTQVVNQRLDTMTGVARVVSDDGSAKLSVTFPVAGTNATITTPYWVLATDYTSYSLVYTCVNIDAERRQVWSWKLGREKQLTNAAVTAINRVIANVPVLDDRYYETRDHSNQGCFYYPEPEAGKPVVFPGQCDPGIQAAANFNMTAFQGIWHEIETYPKEQQSGQCINHRYTLGTANYLNLVSSNVIDEILGVTNSRVTFASAQDSSGRLVINLTSGGTTITIPFWILSIDYEDYALAYSCVNRNANQRAVFSWKLSRSKVLSTAGSIAINNKISEIDVLDNIYYENVDQSDKACFSLPELSPGQPAIFDGQCDRNIPVIQNFNAVRYLGRWRMIETYPSDFQSLISGCNEANYALGPNSVVDVYNTEVINQRLETINGTAVIDGTDGSGKLLVNFPGAPTPSEYWILDTDYDSYALVYSCLNINNQQRRVWSWKLSRTTELTSAATAKIDAIVDSINVLNKRFYMKIDHSDSSCFYYPTPDGNPVEFRGQCDQNLPVVTNFNAVEYQGLWHNIESYPTQNARGTCGNARYTLRDGVVEVFNTQVIDQKLDTISGTASLVATTDGSAKLIVRFPAGPSFTEAPYWVLDTDYRTYSLVYTCINISTERRRGVPVVFRGQCDNSIQAVANFNMTAFQGKWHEVEAYPKEQQTGQCINHEYTLGSGNALDLVSSSISEQIRDFTNSRVTFASAQETSGRLTITLNTGGSTTTIPFWVLSTDYEDHALAYSCVDLDQNSRAVYSWKLSRTQKLSSAAVIAMENKIKEINVLDNKYYENIDQSDKACFYLPDLMPGEPAEFVGQCDENLAVVQNFNAQAYEGRWRMIETYPSDFQSLQAGCLEATYTLTPGGIVQVYNTEVVNQRLDTINGTAVLASTDGSAKLLVNFPGSPEPATYWVLDTDYTSYALVYSCRNIGNQRRRVWTWKLSRTRELTENAKTKINQTVNAVDVLNEKFYISIEHSDASCFYYPIPDGNPVVFRGQCDQSIPVVMDFNAAAYMGTWYDVEGYPVQFQDGTCPSATYSLTSTGVDVYNTQVVDSWLDIIRGSAVLATSDGSAKLTVTFPIAGTNLTTSTPYWVLGTDYSNYALVYTCINIDSERHRVASWKLSRAKTLNAGSKTEIDNLISTVPVLRQDYYVLRGHTEENCFHYPNNEGGPVIQKGQCELSGINVTEKFNITAFTGSWYEISRFPSEIQDGECVSSEFSIDNQKIQMRKSIVSNEEKTTSTGPATLSPDGRGIMTVTLTDPVAGGIFEMTFHVLDVVYDDFALLYGCQNIDGTNKQIYSWKLSRSQAGLSETAVARITQIVRDTQPLFERYFENTDQTPNGCFHYPSFDDLPPTIELVGHCDTRITGKANFDVEAYLGKWNEIASYPQPFQNGECARAQYKLGSDGVDVINTQVVDKQLDVQMATAVVASDDGSGVLEVTFKFPNGVVNVVNYYIIETDYTSFALVYSCRNLTSGSRQVTSWKLSRGTTLSDEALLIIDEAINSTQGLRQDYYQPTSQTEEACFYIPEVNKNEAPLFRGQCGNISGVQGFDIQKYLGWWHEIESYPTDNSRGSCVSSEFEHINGEYHVVDTNIFNNIAQVNSSVVTVTNDGRLTKAYSNGESIDIWVLATDYETYSLLYFCQNVDSQNMRVWSAKHSKTRQLTPAAQEAMANYIVSTRALETQFYQVVDQTDSACFHYPERSGNQIIIPGQCDLNIPVVQKFDVPEYSGTWYQIERYTQVHENGTCTGARYTLDKKTGIVTVLNWQVIGDVLDTVEGTATVNSTDGSAKLIVKLPIRFTEEAEPIMVSTELYILTTDYITHSLAYSCVNVNPYRRAVGVWKLSRTRTLTEESKSAIDEYIATRKELHQPYFDTVEQNDDCDEPSSAILVKSSIIIMLVCSILQFVL
ncbi:uncharacterized protein LOC120632183 [Pararge aegeria]|uniref:uncharacterized protein LOC120632183 n=1 Tax=Pararge aegeria TaxID=116150 RepID=UPI0019D0136E|nr:uncharacterized protein LOC120632183 [Pararge aegeria]